MEPSHLHSSLMIPFHLTFCLVPSPAFRERQQRKFSLLLACSQIAQLRVEWNVNFSNCSFCRGQTKQSSGKISRIYLDVTEKSNKCQSRYLFPQLSRHCVEIWFSLFARTNNCFRLPVHTHSMLRFVYIY